MDYNKLLIKHTSTIREAISTMDKGGVGFSFVVDEENKLIGILTDGDFRRAVLSGISLNLGITQIMNTNYVSLDISEKSDAAVQRIFSDNRIRHIPITEKGVVVDILLRNLHSEIEVKHLPIPNKAVIFAGGLGTRMLPFSLVLPKPLIPIGDKTMLETIMDEYKKYGIDNFRLTLNYKSHIIKAYLSDKRDKYTFEYIDEDQPLGTAGSLALLEKVTEPIFVSNCDILVKVDYQEILNFHKSKNAKITIVASLQAQQVPYGVCEMDDQGALLKILEKPTFDMLVNTGMYILDPDIISEIPINTFFNMTDLIEKIKREKGNVFVFPVTESSYIDIGQWTEYNKVAQSSFKQLL